MTKILCLHTADIHKNTFGNLFARQADQVELTQVVRAAWLERARKDGLTAELKAEVDAYLVDQARTFDAVLCTCSTLGPVAEAASRQQRNIVRIDTPLMARAARHDGVVLVAICLESTRDATLALVDAALAREGRQTRRQVVLCAEAWPSFEQGDMPGFARAIADTVRAAAAQTESLGCIVLAQASMAVAEAYLHDIGIAVYSSPRLAVEETLRVARAG